MSFLEKLGTFTKNLGAAPFAPARFIYEAASAPWRDEEEYNGFINTIKTAGTLAAKQAVAPVLDIFEGIETVAKPARQALSTAGLVLEQTEDNPANLFKKETWDKAQQYKDEASVGQSLYAQRIDPLSMGLKSAATIAEGIGQEDDPELVIENAVGTVYGVGTYGIGTYATFTYGLSGSFAQVQDYIPTGIANHRFIGAKLTSPGFNINSTQTVDGGPVVEWRTTNPNQLLYQTNGDQGSFVLV